ncbi:hypothetical protein KUTeg_016703 [Tegillarca granosa]|uniref:Dystrophin n=1 Tax=Tegillarca granosa TaxID=220873 RepID=A0ABQ9ELN6_TEGGR|nr:hypothetical protein KUTeg_016703 [Tegillarca granosa]
MEDSDDYHNLLTIGSEVFKFITFMIEAERIVDGWEQAETNKGVPYYISHRMQITTWDHPYLTKVMEELVHQVGLNTVKNVFNRHGYMDGCMDIIDCKEVLKLVTDLYMSADQGVTLQDDVAEIYGELLQNLMLNLFDTKDRVYKSVITFYQEVHDPSTYISEQNFTLLLQELMQLPDLLQESEAFGGQDVSSKDAGGGGIPEDMFYVWLLKEPQTLVWLPTFHRTAAAETIKHESKYRCLKCFNFDMCQICFFTGRTKKKHKLKHPIQEYCLATSSRDDTKAFENKKSIDDGLKQQRRELERSPKYSAQNQSPRSQNNASRSKTYSPRSKSFSPRFENSEYPPRFSYGFDYQEVPLPSGDDIYNDQQNGAAYDSLDLLDISPSHFTLPSFANSRVFLDEEAEMDDLVIKAEHMFPSNFSYSVYSKSTRDHDEMLQAASTIGTAMSEFLKVKSYLTFWLNLKHFDNRTVCGWFKSHQFFFLILKSFSQAIS